MYSGGVKTNRDTWAYNFSETKLSVNMGGMVACFNEQVKAFPKASAKGIKVNDFIDSDPKKISWSRGLVADVEKNKGAEFDKQNIRSAYYRPFTKEHIYFHKQFNDMLYRMPIFFPETDSKNLVICLCGVGVTKDFSIVITDHMPDVQIMANAQCFPLRYYQTPSKAQTEELGLNDSKAGWQENVSDFALKEYRAAYKDAKIGKEDIFYYVYGILHSPEYKTRVAADLPQM